MPNSKNRKPHFANNGESRIGYIRSQVKNIDDDQTLSKEDKVNGYMSLCFWLNATYVRDEIYLK
jgi:DNA mismatch repair protein MutH